jgi:hypothetical protein
MPRTSMMRSVKSEVSKVLDLGTSVRGRIVLATPARTIARSVVTSSASRATRGLTWALRTASSSRIRVSHDLGRSAKGFRQNFASDVRTARLEAAEDNPTSPVLKNSSRMKSADSGNSKPKQTSNRPSSSPLTRSFGTARVTVSRTSGWRLWNKSRFSDTRTQAKPVGFYFAERRQRFLSLLKGRDDLTSVWEEHLPGL